MTEFNLLLQKAGHTVPEAAQLLGYSEGHIYRWKRGEETPREGVLNLLRMEIAGRTPEPAETAFSFIDLFAGIGGLRKAMEGAGGRCVFTSEWDKYAQQTYLANFPDNRPIAGDIRDVDAELGYILHTQVIDAAHFVPQHRQRIVMVGFREAVPFSFADMVIPPRGHRRMRDILHPENGIEEPEGHFTLGPDAAVSDKYTLTDKLWAYLQGYAAKHKATLSARYYKDGSEILVSRGEGNNPRRLTPRECARLMGYPEDFRIPVSDTQAYKQFGNSVAVPVFAEVARVMRPHILSVAGCTQQKILAKVG